MKIPAKFLYLNVLIIAVAIILSTFFSLLQMRSAAVSQAHAMQQSHIKAFWELLREKGRDFRIADGKLLAGTYVINGKYELPDRVREIFGGVATIFMGDVRVSTNVLTADGRLKVQQMVMSACLIVIFTLLTALMLRERKRAEVKLEKYNARLEDLVAERI